MRKKPLTRKLTTVGVALIACALFVAGATLSSSVSARSNSGQKASINIAERRRAAQSELRVRLASASVSEFQDALRTLTRLDEPGTLEVWRAALKNPDPQLQREAWMSYREIQSELERKEFVPQVARIKASAGEVLRLASEYGLEVTIWLSSGDQTYAAAPPYLVERLRNAGIDTAVIYESVAEWQAARAGGDVVARAITPEYQSAEAQSAFQVRVAVIDLADRISSARSYSAWLGDRENILMQEGSRVAYLDIFVSDGSLASINAHASEQYGQRGFKVTGLYTLEEFENVAPSLFGGKSFNAGRRDKSNRAGQFQIELSNGKFHSYDQTIAEFKTLASTHPDLAKYVKLGSSFEGREIFGLKISKDAAVDDASKPDILITGCHHAREWISVESPVYVANKLINGYSTDDSIKYLVDHLQVWIVPIVNPDGLNYTQNTPSDQSDPAKLWRKNRHPISIGDCVSSVGVDLNRNYDYQWRTRGDSACEDYCSTDRSCIKDDIGGSDDPRSEIYRGREAGSEPEVKAVKSLVDDPNRHFRAQIDYHNYSQLILYPWGYAPWTTDDALTLSRLAQQMSDAVYGVDRVRYRPEQAIDLYATSGSSIDYAYGVNRVPAPFIVEMRPDCCEFTVPESNISIVNQENWAGARALMGWAAGPPILESVKAYTPGPDGTFSKLVYSVRWSPSPSEPATLRVPVVETRFSGIDPGRIQVRLQFSKPMNTSLAPRATLGRDTVLDELALTAVGDNEGWQKTTYTGDTWIGETAIIEDQDLTTPWQIAVAATDTLSAALDARPATVASYTAGASFWRQYEDSTGDGHSGGTDIQHTLAPAVRGDYPSVLVATPNGGERLAAGDHYTVVWTAPNAPDSDQSLLLSTDGGFSFRALSESIPPAAQRFDVTIPQGSTTRGRIRLVAIDPASRNFIFAGSQADFSIGTNVGSAVDIGFASSERMDLNWTDTSIDDPSNTLSGASRFAINLRITNRGSIPIVNPFLRVEELTRYVLLTRDPRSGWAAGARLSVDAGSDNTLSPGETVETRLVIGLTKGKKFSLSAALYGVPSGGTIDPADAVSVWTGKPKTR
jgi:carboxypeptidase T